MEESRRNAMKAFLAGWAGDQPVPPPPPPPPPPPQQKRKVTIFALDEYPSGREVGTSVYLNAEEVTPGVEQEAPIDRQTTTYALEMSGSYGLRRAIVVQGSDERIVDKNEMIASAAHPECLGLEFEAGSDELKVYMIYNKF